jgi:hypothetical protein
MFVPNDKAMTSVRTLRVRNPAATKMRRTATQERNCGIEKHRRDPLSGRHPGESRDPALWSLPQVADGSFAQQSCASPDGCTYRTYEQHPKCNMRQRKSIASASYSNTSSPASQGGI